MPTTRLSSKGQVVIPQEIRERLRWQPGQELEVEDQGHAVVLKPASLFARTRFEDVRGCLKYDGPPVSVEEMHEAVDRMFREGRQG